MRMKTQEPRTHAIFFIRHQLLQMNLFVHSYSTKNTGIEILRVKDQW